MWLESSDPELIKIGAKVVSLGRYVVFQMAEVAIPRNLFAGTLRLIVELRPPPITFDSVRRSSVMRSSQFTREVRLDDGQVGDFRRALGCLGRANLRMGPPQRSRLP